MDAGWIVGQLVVALVTAVCTGVIVAWASTRVLKEQQRHQAQIAADHADRIAAIERCQAEETAERTRCELRAAHNYVTREEIVRVASEQAAQYRSLDDKMSAVHDRITDLATTVSALKGPNHPEHS
jgi:hypothetical protein